MRLLKLFFLIFAMFLNAQDSINAGGHDIISTSGNVSYSIGQSFYSTITMDFGEVSQGVQQPFEALVLEVNHLLLLTKIEAYPNPVNNYLNLFVEDFYANEFKFQLFDIHGRLLLENQINQQLTAISLESFNFNIIFLSIINKDNQMVKTFKILKK
jgi:hypothetical protein